MSDNFVSLTDSISMLVDELTLAKHWSRPSILMVVYRSEFVRRDAGNLLAQALLGSGQVLRQVRVDSVNFDVPLALVNVPDKSATVFSVHGLRWGGGRNGLNAYRALNLRRELLVDGSLRAVFWLTEAESRRLARRAPDFWAFRHRVISLIDVPVEPDFSLVASLTGVQENELVLDNIDDIRVGMALCRDGLKRDPLQGDLWARLGLGLAIVGQFEEAEKVLRKALRCGSTNPAISQTLKHLSQEMVDDGRAGK